MKIIGEVLGEQQIVRGLTRFIGGVTNLEPAFVDIGQDVREIEDQQFAAEGNGWAPLTPAYATRKRRRWGDKPILRASDRMYNSIIDQDAEGNVTVINAMDAAYGTSIFYARFHQTGTDRMAARRIFALTEGNKRRIMRTLHRYVIKVGQLTGLEVQSTA